MSVYTLKVKADKKGNHIHCRFFTGIEGQTCASIGSLIMGIGDWQHIGLILRVGSEKWPGFVRLEMNDPLEPVEGGSE